jgi:hypothetical protein
VLGDGGTAHREGRRELLDRRRAPGEAGEDRTARRVGQRGESGAQGIGGQLSNLSVN